MTIEQYESITGTTVSASDEARVTAQITKTQRILETLLGYSLTEAEVNDNQYTEVGKTTLECPCPDGVDEESLQEPDPVVYAYRLYNYNPDDKYLEIDPASDVHAVKLVKDGITYRTLEEEEYRVHFKQGITKYIERCDVWCLCLPEGCSCTQLAVDADWLWDGTPAIPNDLLQVWAEMVTYYANTKKDIKSQTLGSHSWTKFADKKPETEDVNVSIIKKYAGPNGSIKRTITI